jgi:hypothetical protein
LVWLNFANILPIIPQKFKMLTLVPGAHNKTDLFAWNNDVVEVAVRVQVRLTEATEAVVGRLQREILFSRKKYIICIMHAIFQPFGNYESVGVI